MCGVLLKLHGHAKVFCSSLQFLSWVRAVSALTESVAFRDSHGNEQIREESLFEQEIRGLFFVRDRRNFNQDPTQKNLYHINVFEKAVHC